MDCKETLSIFHVESSMPYSHLSSDHCAQPHESHCTVLVFSAVAVVVAEALLTWSRNVAIVYCGFQHCIFGHCVVRGVSGAGRGGGGDGWVGSFIGYAASPKPIGGKTNRVPCFFWTMIFAVLGSTQRQIGGHLCGFVCGFCVPNVLSVPL